MAKRAGVRVWTAAAVASLLHGAAIAQQNEPEAPPPTPAELYDQALAAGDWVTNLTLAIADIAYSFETNVNAKDDRESALISAWRGVHQNGDVATVLFEVSGMDVVYADDLTAEESATCRHLNDGRWWCDVNVESFKVTAGFYLEQAPPGAAEDAAAAAPLTPPPR